MSVFNIWCQKVAYENLELCDPTLSYSNFFFTIFKRISIISQLFKRFKNFLVIQYYPLLHLIIEKKNIFVIFC